MAAKRGPGQPQIGPQVKVSLPDSHHDQIAAMISAGEYRTRSEAVRGLVAEALGWRTAVGMWMEDGVRVVRHSIEGALTVVDSERRLVKVGNVVLPPLNTHDFDLDVTRPTTGDLVEAFFDKPLRIDHEGERVRVEWLTRDGEVEWTVDDQDHAIQPLGESAGD